MLKVKLLDGDAKAPTVAHPGEDLGYDLYALETTEIIPYGVTKVRTGIAAASFGRAGQPQGLLIWDRSSIASHGIFTHGGVIDAGYRGEIVLLMSRLPNLGDDPIFVGRGTKIAQMIPVDVQTGEIAVVNDLPGSSRGSAGFGSSGS